MITRIVDFKRSINNALMINGIPSPIEYANSNKIPCSDDPLPDAIMSADPKNAPTHGVQPIENTTPNRKVEIKPFCVTVLFSLKDEFNNLIFMRPVKFSPNSITIAPVIRLIITVCWISSLPIVPAKAPRMTNTSVNPSTKATAFFKVVFLFSALPAK